MNSRPILTALVLSASLAAMPALAATAPNQPGTGSPNQSQNASSKGDSNQSTANAGKYQNQKSDVAPSKLNPLLTGQGEVRIKKLIGSDIYNDQDKKLGSVADVLMGKAGEPSVIVRENSKLHAVPWSKLRFGDAQKDSHNKVLMPDETKDALNATPQFHYKSQNRKGNNKG